MRVLTDLWEHQKAMVDFACTRLDTEGFVWWLAGCSTGKTLAAYKVMQNKKYKKVLVITTKAGAISAWKNGAASHIDGVNVVAPVGLSMPEKMAALDYTGDDTFVYVINYESAWRILPQLKKTGFECVVFDESHKVKAHNSMQSIHLADLATFIPHRIAMTGTGWDDRPTDAYGQVRVLSPVMHRGRVSSALFRTWTEFFNTYVNYVKVGNIPIVKGYKNQDKLRELVNPFTMFVDSEEVLDLPKVVDIQRTLTMPKKMATAYRDMQNDFVAKFGDDVVVADTILEQSIRLHQITSGYYPHDTGIASPIVEDKDNPKLQETIATLDEIGGYPTVIFTRFREDVAALQRVLQKEGYEVRLLTGSVNNQPEWQAGDGQVLIANIQAGGTAVDLSRARYCIYYSLGHSRSDFIQSLARVRRANSDLAYPVTYYHLIMEHTIDVSIRRAMQGKGAVDQYLKEGLTNRAKGL